MKIILFLFFIGMSNPLFAQGEKLLNGKIIVKDAKLSGVTILNLSNEKETQSDSLGNFKILAKVDDLLIFYAPHLDKMLKALSLGELNDIYVRVGFGKVAPQDLIQIVAPEKSGNREVESFLLATTCITGPNAPKWMSR